MPPSENALQLKVEPGRSKTDGRGALGLRQPPLGGAQDHSFKVMNGNSMSVPNTGSSGENIHAGHR
jgi:hypothetical protein